jgi:hypothetical protein
VTNLEKLVNEDLDSSAKHAGSFEAAEQTKEVPLDPAAAEGKALRVSSTSPRPPAHVAHYARGRSA